MQYITIKRYKRPDRPGRKGVNIPYGEAVEERNGSLYYGDVELCRDVEYITTQELEDMYPGLSGKERENAITKKYKTVFIMQIGKVLKSGQKHDGRAPDYDDWELNGDILVYYPVLDMALELSSMGIRVDEEALDRQLKISGCEDRASMPFQKDVLEANLPYTIGGGIGQSRICMFFLQRAHIGEVQSSIWPEEVHEIAKAHGVNIL